MLYFIFGMVVGSMLFEPLIINFIYFSNISLFMDIILTKKNRKKLIKYFEENKTPF